MGGGRRGYGGHAAGVCGDADSGRGGGAESVGEGGGEVSD